LPLYEYKCRSCKALTDATRPMANRGDPVECPLCGDDADLVFSSFAFPDSRKQWSGRKEVNFKTDNRDEIAKKQAALMANSGKMDKWFRKTRMSRRLRKLHENAVEKMISNAPPIRVEQ